MLKYNKTVWVNEETPLNAENLNNIEAGIESNESKIEANTSLLQALQTDLNEHKIDSVDKLNNVASNISTLSNTKQNKLTAGTNITIDQTTNTINAVGLTEEEAQTIVNNSISSKQDKLVSGTNIKNINGESILGEGDISIETFTPYFENKGLHLGTVKNINANYATKEYVDNKIRVVINDDDTIDLIIS
jgi:hypothetical protein